jgi:hypothetical protein
MIADKKGLILRRDHNRAESGIRIAERREDLPCDSEVWMVHVLALFRAREGECNSTKL